MAGQKSTAEEQGELSRRAFLGAAAGAAGLLMAAGVPAAEAAIVGPRKLRQRLRECQPKEYPALARGLKGLSQNQLNQHLGLYRGYVAKLNEIQSKLQTVDLGTANATYGELRALHVEQTFALNGVILHEYYFGNLAEPGTRPSELLQRVIDAEHGGLDKWAATLKAVGKSARGWVLFGLNLRDGFTHFYLQDLHNVYVPSLFLPIVVLDVYEHAYLIDYGTNRAAYLDAFVQHIGWTAANRRWTRALLIPTGETWTE